mgnify:CR=1 FL=1
MAIRDEIKAYIVGAGFKMVDVVDAINDKHQKKDTIANLSNKLTRGTLKYQEAEEIADAIGYKIVWIPKDK